MLDFDRITQNPADMGGKPCIRGVRITVGMIVGDLAAGQTVEQILADSPTSSAKTSPRLSATPPGDLRNERSCFKAHETCGRRQPFAPLGRPAADAGIQADHWSSLGANDAPDEAIIEFARSANAITLTRDLDFGATWFLLAPQSRASSNSVPSRSLQELSVTS